MNKSQNFNKRIAKIYSERGELQPAEEIIFNNIGWDKLKKMKMLDIGIGGGRTTNIFAKKVKEYVGIDYSPVMVSEALSRFPKEDLFVCDAMDLDEMFSPEEFDIVLFSFNGISEIDATKLWWIFFMIKSVLKKNGQFVFSFCNLSSFGRRMNARSVLKRFALKLLNRRRGFPYTRFISFQNGSLVTQYLLDKYFIDELLRDEGFKDNHFFSNELKEEVQIHKLRRVNSIYVWSKLKDGKTRPNK